jgi:hypothetical protein
VRAIAVNTFCKGIYASATCGITFSEAELGEPVMLALQNVRVALTSSVKEILNPDARDGYSSFGSGSFHAMVDLDFGAQLLGRTFTGYPSSNGQDLRIPVELATEPLLALVKKMEFVTRAATDEDVQMFHGHLKKSLDPKPSWWVAERLFVMAQTLGRADDAADIQAWLSANSKESAHVRDEAERALEAIRTRMP